MHGPHTVVLLTHINTYPELAKRFPIRAKKDSPTIIFADSQQAVALFLAGTNKFQIQGWIDKQDLRLRRL